MKKFSTFLPLLLSITLGFAQKKEKAPEWPWQISDILYLSDSTGVGKLAYSDKKSGMVFVNEKGIVEKEVPLPGHVFGFGKSKSNILAFYSNEWDGKPMKEIHAILVDAKTKGVLFDKLVYTNTGENQLDCSLGKDNGGNLSYLLIRTTGLTGDPGRTLSEKEEKKLNTTTALTALFLSDKGEATLRQLPSAAIGGLFLSAYTNRKGEIAIVSELNDQVVAEKFGLDGLLQKKLTSALEFPEDHPSNSFWSHRVGRFDPTTDNTLAFSINNQDHRKRHMLLSLFVFDFATGKVLTNGSSTLDKDYFKQMKDNPELTKTKHFKDVENLKPDGVVYIGDKLAICNQIQYIWSMGQQGSATRYTSEGAIVSIYDRQLKLLHQFFLDENYECFIDIGRGFSYAIRDGKLLLFGNELAGIGAYDNFYYALDTEKFTMEKKKPEWGAVMKSYPVDPATVFWFHKSLLKTHAAGGYFFGKHVDSYLVKADY